jgi:hypothetical protein
MADQAAAVLAQLHTPDSVGRDAALLRTRLYRFSGDVRDYVFAEAIEERLLAGNRLRLATLARVRQCLAAIRAHGQPLPFPGDTAAAEGIDVAAELAARYPYGWQQVPLPREPCPLVVIVGAPRSGTSHLFNVLARTGSFGYFTTASCWAWPVRNLHHSGRHLFTRFGDAVLGVDNKRTRVIPGLVMPAEAEDIWARAVSVYRHVAGHRYQIIPPRFVQPKILQAATAAHASFFGKPWLLVKSPFNSFRIGQIEALWGTAARYIHMIRDRRESADSIRRNRFEFLWDGQLLTAEEAWQMFTSAVCANVPADRLATVTHRELLADPDGVVAGILGWLGIGGRQSSHGAGSTADRATGR